jgi:hypothetical protein
MAQKKITKFVYKTVDDKKLIKVVEQMTPAIKELAKT